MRRFWLITLLLSITLAVAGSVALAQDEETESDTPELLLFTKYPSQVIGIDETVTLNFSLRAGKTPQVADLMLEDLPENWTATFRGDGRIVDSVFVDPEAESTVELRVEPPVDVESGVYGFTVVANSGGAKSELPVELTVQEKVPARLAFEVELPTLRGKPSTTFRYNVTLKNEGDEDLTVNLLAQAPADFAVTFKASGQDVTSLPVKANSSELLSVEADPLINTLPAGDYPISVLAQGGETEATLDLVAQVIGEAGLMVTTPDERLSGEAEAGAETPITIVVQNTGSAAAHTVQISATSPSGWSVEFDPKEIDAIEPGTQAQVTAKLKPADTAIAGDYVVTFRAQPEGGSSQSAQYRVTVRTSTLWGVAGIGLIAVAVVVVGLAVARFGRR